MSDTYDAIKRLQKLGAQKISEDTHIPVNHVQALLNEDFEKFTRVQFLGFISILEREYNLDLSELKEKGLAFFTAHEENNEIFDAGVFVTPSRSKNFTVVYIILAIAIFLFAIYYTFGVAKDTNYQVDAIDNNAIEKAVKTIQKPLKQVEANTTQEHTTNEVNLTKIAQKPQLIKKEKAIAQSLEIKPRSRVWLGYIEVPTNKKYQRTFKNPFDLDPKKEWILMFGHGYIDVYLNGKKIRFSKKDTLRLWYKDGKLQEISAEKFKQLNRGRRW